MLFFRNDYANGAHPHCTQRCDRTAAAVDLLRNLGSCGRKPQLHPLCPRLAHHRSGSRRLVGNPENTLINNGATGHPVAPVLVVPKTTKAEQRIIPYLEPVW